jgi:hypothetical protein
MKRPWAWLIVLLWPLPLAVGAQEPAAAPPLGLDEAQLLVPDFRGAASEPVLAVESNGYIRLGTLTKNRRVRLSGVEFSGREAVRFLQQALRGARVYVVAEAGPRPAGGDDRQPVSLYRAPDGLFLNLELVTRGLARTDVKQAFEYKDVFLEREQEAMRKGLGLWAPDVQGADEARVVAAPAVARPKRRRGGQAAGLAAAQRNEVQRGFDNALRQLIGRVNPQLGGRAPQQGMFVGAPGQMFFFGVAAPAQAPAGFPLPGFGLPANGVPFMLGPPLAGVPPPVMPLPQFP